jgi:nucleoside-diphosphate-sugar epimerase
MSESAGVVLVTGARGFVGAHCLPLLAARGLQVIAVSSAPVQSAPGVTWRTCNLLDPAACAALIERERPTHLLHLAWITTPGVFWSSPANLEWLAAGAHLVERFFQTGGKRAVAMGSCAEYRASDSACREDETPIQPATVYGKAKAAMHLALQAAAQDRGTFAWGRLFFPYGPGEAPGRFISSVIAGLLSGEPVDCTDGTQQRDFVFITDAAAACVALLQSERCGAYNIGTGTAVSLREVTDIIVRRLGRSELLRFGARAAPPFDPPRIVADPTKISAEIGWTPRVALEQGLLRSIEAMKQQRGASR